MDRRYFLCISRINNWLNKKGEIIAYIALLGYADEKLVVRPRKDFDKIVQ